MKSSATQSHPVTGATLIRGTRPRALSVGTWRLTIDMPGWYAIDDLTGEHGLHDANDMQFSDAAIIRLKNQRAGHNERHGDPQAIDAETNQIIEKE